MATKAPVPVEAPMILGVTFPILAFPVVILIPHKIPFVVAAPLDVARLMAVTVLPCTEVAVVVPTARLMAIKRVAIVPAIV